MSITATGINLTGFTRTVRDLAGYAVGSAYSRLCPVLTFIAITKRTGDYFLAAEN